MNSSVPLSSSDHGAALLRVSLGVMWIAHALLKLLVFTLPGTAQFFESVGYTARVSTQRTAPAGMARPPPSPR